MISFFIFGVVFRIFQLVALMCIGFLCFSLLFRNRSRLPSCCAQQAHQGPPNIVYVQRRRFGCMSFLGTCFVVFVIFLGIVRGERHERRHLTEPERRLEEIAQQKRELDNRIETEIPNFVHLLYQQAGEIKKELNEATEESKRSYLMEELSDIARTFVFLDKEETDYKDILSELSSIERTLIRLKESEKLFGSEYDEFINQSRAASAKAKAKLNVKINLEMNKNVSLNEIQVQEKINELMQ